MIVWYNTAYINDYYNSQKILGSHGMMQHSLMLDKMVQNFIYIYIYIYMWQVHT